MAVLLSYDAATDASSALHGDMMHSPRFVAFLLATPLALPAVAKAQTAPVTPRSPVSVDVMSLQLMLEKGVINEAEYESALRDMGDSNGSKGGASNSVVVGKWAVTLYGFVEADYIFDSTESYSDLAGSGLVARPGTYAGGNPRNQFSIRNSRFGFRFQAPEYHSMRASAVVEADFLGGWAAPTYVAATGQPTENQYFTNPVLRARHLYLKVESPIVDALFGQTWQLFGWQTTYHPNSVQIQGLPGEIYARTPQLRLSKTFANRDVTFDIAIAGLRPPQRDSAVPEGQAGLHFAINRWTGVETIGATGSTVSPASIAVTGDLRQYAIPNYPNGGTLMTPDVKSTFSVPKTGGGIAVDAFIPVIPASKERKGNSLSILGEYVLGAGIADLYTGLIGGLGVPPTVPVPTGSPTGTVPTPYNSDVDAGLVTINAQGDVNLIQWQTIRGGLQYTIPKLDGKMWISGNYANVSSPNAPSLLTTTIAPGTGKATTNAAAVRNALNWFDVNVMGDLTPAVRLGIEYAYSADKYLDGVTGKNHRVQGSAFYIF